MATYEAFQATRQPRQTLVGRLAVPYRPASINLRPAFRAAVAFSPFVPPTPPTPPTPPFTPSFPAIPPTFPPMQAQYSGDYGTDVSCLTDLDPYLSLVPALPQDLYHLVTEGPGSCFWSSNVTFSILMLLSQGITQATIAQVQSAIEAVMQSDERVLNAQAIVTFDGEETLTAQIAVIPNQGQTFNYVLSISKVQITLISVGFVNL